ncbi:hypothetical protein BCR35DRAFT_300561 [Leucosporidium creatinivorum]|uniref:Periplasmic copper-binding protein NosD beta helix domain-containing protein n=1 Tax=Leucosporidium creatinivorum TaxID=106004 RepID=A0A1Y2FZ36_9BASI|nr:hypothetical protein BCR35DRAFT_300561 [Leucosporidium creatinivorum]
MLFSTHSLAVATALALASLVEISAALPIDLNVVPSATVELLPYNAASPAATYYWPKPPAIILPLSDVLPYVGAADGFAPDSVLGVALGGSSSKRQKRQLFGFGAKPTTTASTSKATTISAAPTTTTTAKAASTTNCGLFGCPASSSSSAASSSSSVSPSSSSSSTTVKTSSSTTTSASPTSSAAAPASTSTCLGSSTTEQIINSLFNMGGAGTTVYLCPSVSISISNPIQFTAAGQTLITRGAPTDSTRATIVVTGATQTNAIIGSCTACSNVALRNVQINGNRPALGFISSQLGGSALLEMGGSNQGQIIDSINAYEPRSWSTLHAMEGTNNMCSGMQITGNTLGPAGAGATGTGASSNQLQGQWADAISLACQGSTITGNTLIDATDGALVVFGAPSSTITGNSIVAVKRNVMGGINMVDPNPFSGSFSGVLVANNIFNSSSAMIKVGIPMGPNVWGSQNTTSFTFGGTVRDNLFVSGPAGYFGWGIGIAGHADATISGNSFQSANFAGVPTSGCPTAAIPPIPQPLVYDPAQIRNITIKQAGFTTQKIMLLICEAPNSPMTTTGFTASY